MSTCCSKQIEQDTIGETKENNKWHSTLEPRNPPKKQSYRLWGGAASSILNDTPCVCMYASYNQNSHKECIRMYRYILTLYICIKRHSLLSCWIWPLQKVLWCASWNLRASASLHWLGEVLCLSTHTQDSLLVVQFSHSLPSQYHLYPWCYVCHRKQRDCVWAYARRVDRNFYRHIFPLYYRLIKIAEMFQ